MVKLLIEGKATIDSIDHGYNATIYTAIRSNHLDVAQELLDRKADINATIRTSECRCSDPCTLLMYASIKANTELIMFLLENRADVNHRLYTGSAVEAAVGRYVDPRCGNEYNKLYKTIQCLMTSKAAVITYFRGIDYSYHVIKALEAEPQFVLKVCPKSANEERQMLLEQAFQQYKTKVDGVFCSELDNLFDERFLSLALLDFYTGSIIPEKVTSIIVGEVE